VIFSFSWSWLPGWRTRLGLAMSDSTQGLYQA
jgi:hypothetical protein